MKIVGIDPGKATGVAVAVFSSDGNAAVFDTYCIKDHDIERDRSIVRGADVVVCEDFRLDGRVAPKLGGDRMWSSEGIGYWRALSLLEGATFVLQDRSWKGKTNAAQKERIEFFTGLAPKTPHERDALAHVIAFLLRIEETPSFLEERAKAWLIHRRK